MDRPEFYRFHQGEKALPFSPAGYDARLARLRQDMEIPAAGSPGAAPFDIPDNLPTLEVDPNAALDPDELLAQATAQINNEGGDSE